jgi:hypothetical protein
MERPQKAPSSDDALRHLPTAAQARANSHARARGLPALLAQVGCHVQPRVVSSDDPRRAGWLCGPSQGARPLRARGTSVRMSCDNRSRSHFALLVTSYGCLERTRVRLLRGSREKSRTPAGPDSRQFRQQSEVRPRQTCLWVPHSINPPIPKRNRRPCRDHASGRRARGKARPGLVGGSTSSPPEARLTGSTATARPDGSPSTRTIPSPSSLRRVGSGVSRSGLPSGSHGRDWQESGAATTSRRKGR